MELLVAAVCESLSMVTSEIGLSHSANGLSVLVGLGV